MKSTECKKISSGSDEGGGEGHIGGTCNEVSNVGSSSEGGGGRHPGESTSLESPAGGEIGGGESDGEGGSVEGDVGDNDGRVG